MPSTLSLAPNWRPRLLTRKDLPAKTLTLASFLVGKLLVHLSPGGMAGGRIMGFAARRNATRLYFSRTAMSTFIGPTAARGC